MRYLILLPLLACAPKQKPIEPEQALQYKTNPAVLELFDEEDEDLFDELPEAGQKEKDKDEESEKND